MNYRGLLGYMILSLAFFFTTELFSQNAPVTTATTLNNAVPGTINIPVTVIGFSNIGAFSLSIDYDYAVIHYLNAVKNPLLAGVFNVADNDLGNGRHRIIMGWFGSASALPDGATTVTVSFSFISGSSDLTWYDNGGSCEYSNGSSQVLNDLPTATYYINGYVCGVLTAPGTISGNTSVCSGETGVYYSIDPVPGAGGYAWTVPPGAVISGGGNSTWIYADYPPGSSSGFVTAAATNYCGAGPASQLAVTVNPQPNANAGNDTTVLYLTSASLHAASGGTGSFSYQWLPAYLLVDPDVQNPLTVPLFSTTLFTVFVTNNATLCQHTDQVTVFVSGGPLSVNPVAMPDSVCKGSASQLYANAGGGSGNYTYLWTCSPAGSPPWTSNSANPIVTPDTTTDYLLTINDGYNNVSGSVSVTVTGIPGTPVIAFGNDLLVSDTCCGNQWYRNGLPIPGADGETYLPEEEGLYFAMVTIGSCSSDTSNAIYLFATEVQQDPVRDEVLLFPNPAKDHLYVTIKDADGEVFKATIFNISGQEVASCRLQSMVSTEPFKLELSPLRPGIYAVILQGSKGTSVRRIFLIH